jgi:hypothetical protein
MAMSFWNEGGFGKRFGGSRCIVLFLTILLALLLFGAPLSAQNLWKATILPTMTCDKVRRSMK